MANPRRPSNYRSTLPKPAAPAMPGMRAGGLMGAASTMPQLPQPPRPVTTQAAGTSPLKGLGNRLLRREPIARRS